MLWFELLLENIFELRNREEHLIGFVSRNGQGIDSLVKEFRFFPFEGSKFEYFYELMIIIEL